MPGFTHEHREKHRAVPLRQRIISKSCNGGKISVLIVGWSLVNTTPTMIISS